MMKVCLILAHIPRYVISKSSLFTIYYFIVALFDVTNVSVSLSKRRLRRKK